MVICIYLGAELGEDVGSRLALSGSLAVDCVKHLCKRARRANRRELPQKSIAGTPKYSRFKLSSVEP